MYFASDARIAGKKQDCFTKKRGRFGRSPRRKANKLQWPYLMAGTLGFSITKYGPGSSLLTAGRFDSAARASSISLTALAKTAGLPLIRPLVALCSP